MSFTRMGVLSKCSHSAQQTHDAAHGHMVQQMDGWTTALRVEFHWRASNAAALQSMQLRDVVFCWQCSCTAVDAAA